MCMLVALMGALETGPCSRLLTLSACPGRCSVPQVSRVIEAQDALVEQVSC